LTQELCIFAVKVRKYKYFLKFGSDFYTDLLTSLTLYTIHDNIYVLYVVEKNFSFRSMFIS